MLLSISSIDSWARNCDPGRSQSLELRSTTCKKISWIDFLTTSSSIVCGSSCGVSSFPPCSSSSPLSSQHSDKSALGRPDQGADLTEWLLYKPPTCVVVNYFVSYIPIY
jgi:hypothetical protein